MLEIVLALMFGALLGALAVVFGVTSMIHQAAKASVLSPARREPRDDDLVVLTASGQAELDAADAWRNLAGLQNGVQEGPQRPTADARPAGKAPGCGYCKRLRKALFGRF
jgi:hypothetical protein